MKAKAAGEGQGLGPENRSLVKDAEFEAGLLPEGLSAPAAGGVVKKAANSLWIGKGTLPCAVDRAQALAFLGHRGQQLGENLQQRLEAAACRCEGECNPRYTWRTFEIEPAPEGPGVALCGCGLLLPGESIAKHLAGARYAALLVVTLGAGWQQAVQQLQATSPTDALLYDACASAATEGAANDAHAALAQAARNEGLQARARFSPGYGDLPLSVHPDFLEAADASRQVGVFSTERNLLAPAKSITAVVGLFAAGEAERAHDAESVGDVDSTCGAGAANERASREAAVSQCAECAARDYCNFREAGTTCCG